MRNTLFALRYRSLLIASHIALMAVFVAIMNFSKLFQAILIAASALIFLWIFTPRESGEIPCGEEVGPEGIARHMQEWHQD